ncbi:unnamed protein product [Polarella glacialis]|uniref:Uncharacterized protein n=1 Tax=Polarella glacialis TaxID=89957 RepID=A0A813G447_POLGL|nr:unnamed protein product [Polarella glacialis]
MTAADEHIYETLKMSPSLPRSEHFGGSPRSTGTRSPTGTGTPQVGGLPPPTRFTKATLHDWFQDMDQATSGINVIPRRAVALKIKEKCQSRDSEAMLAVRAKLTEVANAPGKQTSPGFLNWEEFLDFFRQTGLLLEYNFQTARSKKIDQTKIVEDGEA